jgi:hypothetical protein
MKVHEAEAEAAEVRSWFCETCDTMTEDGEKHCLSCKSYWADVESGLFDDEWSL